MLTATQIIENGLCQQNNFLLISGLISYYLTYMFERIYDKCTKI
jgi:hypothetical protein